jgi:hypothetical protein
MRDDLESQREQAKRRPAESQAIDLDDDNEDDANQTKNGVTATLSASDTDEPSSVTPMSVLKELAAERQNRERIKPDADFVEIDPPSLTYKVLTYNVWFEESVCMTQRMAALGNIIDTERADFVFLQVGRGGAGRARGKGAGLQICATPGSAW